MTIAFDNIVEDDKRPPVVGIHGELAAKTASEAESIIRDRYTQIMYRQMLPGMWGSVAMAMLLCWVLWDVTNHITLFMWLGVVASLSTVRTMIVFSYRQRELSQSDLLIWERLIFWPHCMSGLVWGVGCLAIMPANDVDKQVIVYSYLVGLSCGSAGLYAGQIFLKALTLISFLLPMTAWFFLFGDSSQMTLAIGTSMLAIFMIKGMRSQSQLLKDTLRLAGDLETARAAAEKMARTDALTGLNNRRAFSELGTALLAQAQRQSFLVSAVMLDIDHFKRINDKYGHEVGDKALQHVATIVQNNIRNSDVCGRIGGEEFAILLPWSDLSESIAVSEKIRHVISASPLHIDNFQIDMTGSFGVSSGANQMDILLRIADSALYEAKTKGRNQVVGKDNFGK
jgi:diguanylate cyclase (GGDEF)-like protein